MTMTKIIAATVLTGIFLANSAELVQAEDTSSAGSALLQEAIDPDLLNSRERSLARHPWINPDWTWVTEDHAIQILRGEGYDVVLSLEKSGAAWRGKAMRDNESYHVAINRYCDVYSHLDKKSLSLRELQARKPGVETAPKIMVATLNGPVATPTSQMAPTQLTLARRPVATMMGEVGWTWMNEGQVQKLFNYKGYTKISDLRRDVEGIWRAKAIKDDLALRIAIDVYGNVDAQPDSQGGLAQASSSE